jgi:hypothetical protein
VAGWQALKVMSPCSFSAEGIPMQVLAFSERIIIIDYLIETGKWF